MENKKNNTGYMNTGNNNTGSWNTGDNNTGSWNTGDNNTGNWNTGSWNTGYMNTGNNNTGSWNTGSWNTGYMNTGNWNTGICNTITPKVTLFNKESSIDFGTDLYDKIYNVFNRYSKPLCEWVSANNMTNEEKENNKTWETTQGYLKVNKEKYSSIEITTEDEEFIRGLPNFDEQILLECTGIDLTKKKVKICIDGKDILISKEEFENIKKQFIQ